VVVAVPLGIRTEPPQLLMGEELVVPLIAQMALPGQTIREVEAEARQAQ
jgi:hypothetical protein